MQLCLVLTQTTIDSRYSGGQVGCCPRFLVLQRAGRDGSEILVREQPVVVQISKKPINLAHLDQYVDSPVVCELICHPRSHRNGRDRVGGQRVQDLEEITDLQKNVENVFDQNLEKRLAYVLQKKIIIAEML